MSLRKKNSSANKSQILVNGIQNSTRETQNFRPRRELIIIYAHISTWKESCACCLIKKILQYWWTYFQGRNRDTAIENNRLLDTAGEEGVKNWESNTETYTLPCV